MTVWAGKPLALAIHNHPLAEPGGGAGIRDEGLLDSARARPQQLFVYDHPPRTSRHWSPASPTA
jgi:death-on-curing protein